MLSVLAQAWAAANATWLQRVFSSYSGVALEIVRDAQQRCIGYEYVLQNAVTATRFGKPAEVTAVQKGAVCGDFGGKTKTGGPCKNPGKNAGNRCYAHPIALMDISYDTGAKVDRVVISPGSPDNQLRDPIAWEQIAFQLPLGVCRAIDYFSTPPPAFKSAYLVLNGFINSWQDQYGPVLDFNIICQYGPVRASAHWPIERLRAQLNYAGPWRTCGGEQVALQGRLLGDYTPGIWM